MAIEINKVYTRTGDRGRTGLSDGSRRLKCDLRVESYGLTDHLNSFIGSLYAGLTEEKYSDIRKQIEEIQQVMFNLGAELSLPGKLPEKTFYPPVSDEDVAKLENWMDALGADLPDLASFVLPGSDELNARTHLCRSASRNAERCMIRLDQEESVRAQLISYINRLSDYFFVLSRVLSNRVGSEEVLWKITES